MLVAGELVDCVWHDAKLVVELDSRAFHSTQRAFERDRVRDTKLQLAGYRVIRITHRQLVREPDAVAHVVRRMLAMPHRSRDPRVPTGE